MASTIKARGGVYRRDMRPRPKSRFIGTVSAVGGADVLLAGRSDGVATVTGQLEVTYELQGSSSGFGIVTGILNPQRGLVGASSGVSIVTGQIEITYELQGSSFGVAAVTGTLLTEKRLA